MSKIHHQASHAKLESMKQPWSSSSSMRNCFLLGMANKHKALVVALVTTIGLLIILHSAGRTASPLGKRAPEPWEIEDTVKKPYPLKLEEFPATVEALIDAIRATTRKASANGGNNFSASMRREWHLKNPCQSRRQMGALYSLRKETRDLVENPKWIRVLKEYEILHRTCVAQMGSVTDFFLQRKLIPGCKFVVADTERGTGIGNKLLSIVSIFVYAVLTQRVMLVPFSTTIPGVMCEPFEGSSWVIDPELRNFTLARENPKLWGSVSKFYQNVDECSMSDDDTAAAASSHAAVEDSHDSTGATYYCGSLKRVKSIYASRASEDWDCQPQPRFFCDTEQAHYTGVSWIYFREALYFLPKLFAVPSFRPVMEDLFPDRYVLPHVLRSIMLPSDAVWGRVRQVHDAHFRHADARVGIQVRYFHGLYDFNLLHEATEKNIHGCLVEHKLLPDVLVPDQNLHQEEVVVVEEEEEEEEEAPHGSSASADLSSSYNKTSSDSLKLLQQPLKVTTVFIASLYHSLNDKLTKLYVRRALETGDAIGIVQLTSERDQFFGVEVDRQALTEILCLSLSDHLILTPQSTFGALAQGYGALKPWFTDIRPETSSVCVRGQTPETCYQIPNTKKFSCPHDLQVHGKLMSDLVPYITDCHLVEEPFVKVRAGGLGLQLLTSQDESSSDNSNKP
jgi:xyloglucan fucosyltransferase